MTSNPYSWYSPSRKSVAMTICLNFTLVILSRFSCAANFVSSVESPQHASPPFSLRPQKDSCFMCFVVMCDFDCDIVKSVNLAPTGELYVQPMQPQPQHWIALSLSGCRTP